MVRMDIRSRGMIGDFSFVVVGAPRGLMGNMLLLYVGKSTWNDLERLYRLDNLL
jgi:hypothetical protein